MATQAAGALTAARAQVVKAQRGEAEQAQQVGVERTAREAAEQKADASEQKADASEQKAGVSEEKAVASEQRAQQANDALHKLSAKADARGMVITLSGSVLFRPNGADLLPAALRRLDEVAAVLVAQGQNVVVEGYTDSTGSPWSNVDLSRRRAEAVRSYLISRGCPTDRIVARGMGPDRPVADNASGEGRANNRRVEIVINRADRRETMSVETILIWMAIGLVAGWLARRRGRRLRRHRGHRARHRRRLPGRPDFRTMHLERRSRVSRRRSSSPSWAPLSCCCSCVWSVGCRRGG